ncbi:MAG TPA: hypothetical protein VE398_23480 [Acidobacteriota bacterium]|nr:hypothetical protein [Acidobacteriota bacterium]
MVQATHAPHATYEDANLIMQLYDLRREEKLRKARDWFLREFRVDSVKEFFEKYPTGSEQNAFYRMVVGYWDMAASFLVQGIVHEELFFGSSGELLAVWERTKALVEDFRVWAKNPCISLNIEKAAARHIAWLNQRAPGAYEAMQEWMRGYSSKA